MATRREFLAGLAAAGVAAASPVGASLAQSAKPTHHGVIDTHHHFWAPEYKKLSMDWDDAHHSRHAPTIVSWTPEVTLQEMDRGGVKTAVLSLASIRDGFWGLDPQAATRMVRICGDYAAQLMSDHPGRFGLFAPLNMLDVDLCLKEAEYALDQLHADGIGVQSSYNGRYPGDAFYAPLWEEMNRRKAVVYFHGPVPGCCGGLKVGPGVNPAVEEVTFDMTRAAVSLLANGCLARYRDIKWCFSYGGGTVPMLASRINAFFKNAKNLHEIAPDGVFAALARLHYDTVNVTDAPSWAALTKLVKPTQIVYGTDFPYFHNDQLDTIDKRGLSAHDKALILSGNAKRLMPRLARI
ncbi:MAG TPA: amidohydrolase family protein [Stellaceae bacterium]|nr:amidohydrolase family protein [Stellaceae bacterium]